MNKPETKPGHLKNGFPVADPRSIKVGTERSRAARHITKVLASIVPPALDWKAPAK